MTQRNKSVYQMAEILIIDLGSQYTLVIGRTLREMGYRVVIASPPRAKSLLKTWTPKLIILSGGSASVYEDDAPQPPIDINTTTSVILGICYGMQWIAKQLGGKVTPSRTHKEYGEVVVDFTDRGCDVLGVESSYETADTINSKDVVWGSHGDTVEELPKDFSCLGYSEKTNTIAGMISQNQKIIGLQYHPEVTHTVNGKQMLKKIVNSAGCEKNWQPQDVIDEIRVEVKKAVIKDGQPQKAIIGFSGGVDSTTLSAIISPIFGDNLLAVCINAGNLRKDEIKQIRQHAKIAGVKLKVVNASKEFIRALSKATNSEQKRKIFKKLYQKFLEQVAKEFGAKFIFQGTLATDIIESGAVGESALIKSHHNVGLKFILKALAPLRKLFKYEIRDLSRQLGLPASISEREPFPGPGLFVRIVGETVTAKRLSIVRWADHEVRKILDEHELSDQISQLVVYLDCLKTVGIKGDSRAYGYSITVRGVITSDFMTVRGYQIPAKVRREITSAITKHPKIVRVKYDETNKPPATTEAE